MRCRENVADGRSAVHGSPETSLTEQAHLHRGFASFNVRKALARRWFRTGGEVSFRSCTFPFSGPCLVRPPWLRGARPSRLARSRQADGCVDVHTEKIGQEEAGRSAAQGAEGSFACDADIDSVTAEPGCRGMIGGGCSQLHEHSVRNSAPISMSPWACRWARWIANCNRREIQT